MTLSEFKAWLEGFEAAMGDAPTSDQWGKIKAKLAEVSTSPNAPTIRSVGTPNIVPSTWPYQPVVCSETRETRDRDETLWD